MLAFIMYISFQRRLFDIEMRIEFSTIFMAIGGALLG